MGDAVPGRGLTATCRKRGKDSESAAYAVSADTPIRPRYATGGPSFSGTHFPARGFPASRCTGHADVPDEWPARPRRCSRSACDAVIDLCPCRGGRVSRWGMSSEGEQAHDRGGFEHRLRAEIEQIARDLRAEHANLQGTLEVITKSARDVVPGAEDAGITLITRGRGFASRAATSPLPKLIDDLQHRLQDGPCVQAIWQHETVLVADMTTEVRWPLFAPEAARAGARSMLAFQLYTTENTMGALNLHSTRPNAFDDTSISVGGTLATHAAIALIACQREEQFRDALASRDLIGQAKGILMHRYAIDAEQAFTLLTRRSQHTNTPVNEVAAHIVEHGPDTTT